MKEKKRKHGVYTLAVSLLSLLLFLTLSHTEEVAPDEIMQAARNNLSSFLDAIPASDLPHYGFSTREELAGAILGKPFRVYTIVPDKILAYTPQTQLLPLISPLDLWFFPVLSNGDFKTILTVDKVAGEWQAVAIGSSALARQLEKIQGKWPESQGYEHKFVRIFQALSDFIVVSKNDTVSITPFESGRVALKLKKAPEEVYELYKPSDIVPQLIPIVRQNIQSDSIYKK